MFRGLVKTKNIDLKEIFLYLIKPPPNLTIKDGLKMVVMMAVDLR